ncbi:MAG: SDR family NAD(P)-dependent oxidoreductase, partial [Actinobacteria bacterium]|nr:SDR family NAD(P)-dependent oxidoreductase [Actinomycetota bacterium]
MMPTPPPGRELLAGKRVVVTAAAGTGIGSAVAERCLLEGAQVLISDIHERRLGETADRLAEATGVRPHTAICNVTVEDDVQALVAAAVEAMGGIDVMMNNAGLGGQVKLVDMTDEQWSSVLTVTLDGTMRCTRAVMRHMIDAGIEIPVVAKGNCGIPQYVDGAIHFHGSPELMAQYALYARDAGATIIGGCCG